ncbi:MAG: tetratricopeptide repeat protein [Pseudomonadota bacterium]
MIRVLAICFAMIWGSVALAQDRAATLADMQRELTTLRVELQQLRAELAPSTPVGEATETAPADVTGPLERLDGLERQVRALTAQTEELAFRIDRIVKDGTNRLGDLEFRMVELEGGDLGQIPPTATLGGGTEEPATPLAPPAPSTNPNAPAQFAVAETADFEAAMTAVDQGDHADGLAKLDAFLVAYPGSPLTAEAQMLRGAALHGLDRVPEAGRAYLEAYTLAELNDPALAADALTSLGEALHKLEQTPEACLTLDQVRRVYPGTAAAQRAETALAGMSCAA